MEGLQNNNSKPFWKYIKSKKQDSIGVAPLKDHGKLFNDAKDKAEILVKQFQSVFTTVKTAILQTTNKLIENNISNITVINAGLVKHLKDINPSKASGPDEILNRILKKCAVQIAPGLAKILQKSLDTGELPEDWRNANISCVFKKVINMQQRITGQFH